ncbi:unnamed protein product (macronuclear) [Paramecium tetraurelia]|uniref:Uncharacterized protein n=1 Tax=Paramecium tetraurelia TaxID=5888 RepID=A0BK94_PARTE|nr:uncharacterized protein GSPATT00029591001 [Paramecium tetraurelia]CAK58961.1 unnamed protein product [Paramecium tetraurelia]|eukprot:XP_001426359.1 hypothetical protein (macronuclear) [Paramecium tetraurelia strain d4-2]
MISFPLSISGLQRMKPSTNYSIQLMENGFQTLEEIKQDYYNFLTTKQFLVGRDNRFQICKNTESGKIQFFWFRLEQKFTAFKKIHNFDKVTKIEFANYEELKEDVRQEIGFILPDRNLIR